MELPPPIFGSLPSVEAIEPTEDEASYRVTLAERGNDPKTAVFQVVDTADPRTAAPDWDIFWRWPRDAESVRSVIRQVLAVHDTRQR